MFFPFIITAKLYFNHHGNFLEGENVEEGTIHYRRVKTRRLSLVSHTPIYHSVCVREQTS